MAIKKRKPGRPPGGKVLTETDIKMIINRLRNTDDTAAKLALQFGVGVSAIYYHCGSKQHQKNQAVRKAIKELRVPASNGKVVGDAAKRRKAREAQRAAAEF